jgi:hypothetical protein
MLGIAAARDLLGVDVDDILSLIADGKLAWAWDIGLGSRRAEIRILSKCLRGYQATGSTCNLRDAGEEQIIGWILARHKLPWIAGVSLKFILACENDLIIDLIEAGELKHTGGWRRGPGGSPNVTRESVVAFLKRRRVA